MFINKGFIMAIVTLHAAKEQLNVTEGVDDLIIMTYINAAIGIVEHMIERDLYETQAEVPSDDTNSIVYESLKQSKQSALQAAIMLALSTLYTYRESELDVDLSENPAFKSCLAGFTTVVVG